MRKRLGTAAAVAPLAVALGGVVRTATAASPATAEITVVMPGDTLVLTVLDLEHDGLTQGDRFVFRGQLWDAAESHRMGRAKGECVIVSNKLTDSTGRRSLASPPCRRRRPSSPTFVADLRRRPGSVAAGCRNRIEGFLHAPDRARGPMPRRFRQASRSRKAATASRGSKPTS